MRLIVRHLAVAFLTCWAMLGAGIGLGVYQDNDTWADRLFIGGLAGAFYCAVTFALAVGVRTLWMEWVDHDDD